MITHKIEIELNLNDGNVVYSQNKLSAKSLTDYTIEEIKEIGKQGKAKELFNIGDKLDIELTNGEILTVAIADFDHDIDENGNIVPITFTAVNLLEEDCSMTGMQEYLENVFTKLLPENVRKAITPVRKGEKVYPLFLHNEMEIFGKTIYSNDNTGKQYPYYSEKCHRCKFRNREEFSTFWWERSAYYSGSNVFCFVGNNGGADSNSARWSYAVAPAFGI